MPTYGLYLSTLVHEFIGIYVRKLSKKFDLKESLHNILFVPLEVIIENHSDNKFLENFLRMITMKDNSHNIYDSFNNNKRLNNV
ncbi:hypothetical protein [Arcobacter ellisii]|uniref:Uncharacterized protein n=1 Tax=Arcobacter ellisii TaxID=913109 RepID=A0AA94FAA2_9BACT|nr:hypothetical protein [Arcobacter ellisii]RXI31383.1 hypothetical protein CP962_04525 [Arcobacter ellisii]